jgi:dienelactone hydrolase
MKTELKIKTKANDLILADLFHDMKGKKPLVIFCHGFKGFKDWGGFPYMMEKLSDAGFAALSFNFTFNGVSEANPTEFERLDLFAQNTFSRELDDLNAVIDYFETCSELYYTDSSRIAVIGHSRGGGIAIIKASNDRRIKCLITLSAVSNFARYSEHVKKIWREKGYIEVENQRTGQIMRINVTLLDDIESNSEKLDILAKAGKLNKPYLIIHGAEDLSVGADEAKKIFDVSDKSETGLVIIPNTGHTFGVVHPFAGTTPAFEKVIEEVIGFLRINLL